MIQEPPFSSTPVQLETTDHPVKEVLSDGESDALKVSETTRTVVTRKSKLSEDEIRLGEEAFLNALNELEALGKTAAEVENERAEKERQVWSENEAPRRTQEQPIEATSWRLATHVQLGEEECSGKETPQSAECEGAQEAARPHDDDSSQGAHLAESLTSEADIGDVPSQTPWTGGDLQRDELAVVATVPLEETASETWGEDLDLPAEVIRRLNSDSSSERSVGLGDLARLGGENAFRIIARAFDEESEDVRSAAARALFDLRPDRAASFARALREGSPERRRRIGAALATSGLAGIAIGNLTGQTREQGYEAFSLLFLMTKAGEVQPLLRAVEDHPNIGVRLTVIRLLALNGQADIVPSFRRLAVCGVLPSEVRAAVVEAIFELGRHIPRQHSSGAKI